MKNTPFSHPANTCPTRDTATHTETCAWLRLLFAPGVGPATRLALLKRFGDPQHILAQSSSVLQETLSATVADGLLAEPDPTLLQRHLDWLAQPANSLMTLADPDYPRALLHIANPPSVFFVKGQRALLNRPALAVVGSRHATPSGTDTARAFAQALAAHGWVIVSGLALGIDAAAHEGALTVTGDTIAVVGTGLDRVYPIQHKSLARRIAEVGTLVSEYPLGTPPSAGHFPQRNRIISGLTQGCLVVEAALDSGSLITAREALDTGREVFAVPGSIHAALSKGCHQLIKSGAKLVESIDDILMELPPGAPDLSRVTRFAATAPAEIPQCPDRVDPATLPKGLAFDPIDLDTLSLRSGWTIAALQSTLLTLELDGIVEHTGGGHYRRRR